MHLEKLKEALRWLAENLPPSSALSFRPNVVFPRHRAVAVEWLKTVRLAVSPQNVSLTNGATAAMTVALMSVASARVDRGDRGDRPSHAGAACHLSRLQPARACRSTTRASSPTALDEACRTIGYPRGVRAALGDQSDGDADGRGRRAEIAEVARRHDIAIIENDVLGPLVENRPPPIAALRAGAHALLTSFTKITVPGLRIGYLVAPDRYVAAVANRHLVSNWMATPMVAEIASKWVIDGTAMELVRWQRACAARGASASRRKCWPESTMC